jgi:hypothetical protein
VLKLNVGNFLDALSRIAIKMPKAKLISASPTAVENDVMNLTAKSVPEAKLINVLRTAVYGESDAMNQIAHLMPQAKLINVLPTAVENDAMYLIVRKVRQAVMTNV